LTFGSALVALAYHVVTAGGPGFFTATTGWLAGIAFFLLPFALGGMGGGDVKLMGALGAWLGPALALWVALYSGAAGGLLALSVAMYQGYLKTALANVWLLLAHWRVAGLTPLGDITLATSKGPRLAYAVPIFAGTIVAVWLR
jgi:prepilin peptidase CpaA